MYTKKFLQETILKYFKYYKIYLICYSYQIIMRVNFLKFKKYFSKIQNSKKIRNSKLKVFVKRKTKLNFLHKILLKRAVCHIYILSKNLPQSRRLSGAPLESNGLTDAYRFKAVSQNF